MSEEIKDLESSILSLRRELTDSFDTVSRLNGVVDALERTPAPGPLVPEGGWMPEDFPTLTIDHIPYTTSTTVQPDPYMTVSPSGWLLIQAGHVRIGLASRDEWNKLVNMAEALWNTHELRQQHKENTDATGNTD